MAINIVKHTETALSTGVAEELKELIELAEENVEAALSAETRRKYASQFRVFEEWTTARGLPALPTTDEILLTYLTFRAKNGAALSTLSQALAAIREQHRMANMTLPRLENRLYRSWTGARKKVAAEREIQRAAPLLVEHLQKMLPNISGPLALRDKALLLVGWCAMLRREELTALRVRDIRVEPQGLRLTVTRSKTDQWGRGAEIGIAAGKSPDFCPKVAWEGYLATREDIDEKEPAFLSVRGKRLSGRDVGRILVKRAREAELGVRNLSGHSLRAGCITSAAAKGLSLKNIQRQSRHKSLETLLLYIRTATLFEENVTEALLCRPRRT